MRASSHKPRARPGWAENRRLGATKGKTPPIVF
jgi:hypothetical protein